MRPHWRSSAPALRAVGLGAALSLLPAGALAFRKGPYVQAVERDRAVLMWESSAPGAARVVVRRSEAEPPVFVGELRTDEAAGVVEVPVRGLLPATRYLWKVEQAGASAEGRLRTAPMPGDPFTAVVYGDNRTDHRAHAAVVGAILRTEPDLLVNTGDLVSVGEDPTHWQIFFDVAAPLLREVPLYPVSGNHEGLGDAGMSLFRRYFHLPHNELFFAFTWGNARFIAIDANVRAARGAPDTEQAAWLLSEVAAARADPAIDHVIAYIHQGPYSSNPNRTGNRPLRPLVEQMHAAGLDLLVSGHDHFYERGRLDHGLAYLVVGSGGAPLYPTLGPGRRGGYVAEVSRSQHAFVRLRVAGRYLGGCAVDLDGIPFDCFDLPPRPGR